MSHLGSFNNWFSCDLIVALSPQQAAICEKSGFSKADVHSHLCRTAGRRMGDLRRGGNYRDSRMKKLPIPVDLNDDEFFVPTIKDPNDLKVIVAGGIPGPVSVVMHGWNGTSRATSRAFTV